MRKILAASVIPAAVILLANAPAWAGDEGGFLIPPRLGLRQEKEAGVDVAVSLLGRASAIEGDIEADVGLEFGNLFNSGAGFALEAAILWRISPGWKLGPCVTFGYDVFGGEIVYDQFGNSLEADDLHAVTFLWGCEGQVDFGTGFFLDVHMGLGFANYSGVNGILTILTIPVGVEIFSGGPAFALDFGSRLGFNLCDFLFLELGFSLRAQGAPQEGNIDLSPESPLVAAIEFGGGVRF